MPVFHRRHAVPPSAAVEAAPTRRVRPPSGRIAVAAGLALALVAPAAMAHPALAGSTPKNGEVLATPPGRIVLRFSEAVEAGFTHLEVSGPAGEAIAATPSKPAAGDDRSLAADLPPLKAGAYGVRWSALGTDGHRTRGTIAFTVK